MKYPMSPRSQCYQPGFTLIELMTTMAAGLFMLTMVVPGITNINQNTQQTRAANSLLATLNAARDQAIQRDARLSVCQSDNGVTCGDGGWHLGWILFTDAKVPGKVDKDDVILYKAPPLADELRVTSASFNNYISYLSDGTSNASGKFDFSNTHNGQNTNNLFVSATGRATIETNACHKKPIICQ